METIVTLHLPEFNSPLAAIGLILGERLPTPQFCRLLLMGCNFSQPLLLIADLINYSSTK